MCDRDVQGQINALEEEIGRAREALQACKDEVVAARREEADAKGVRHVAHGPHSYLSSSPGRLIQGLLLVRP